MSATTLLNLTDNSVTASGTAQNALTAVSGSASNPRNFLMIQNVHATNSVGVSFTGTAVLNAAGTIMLLAGSAPLTFSYAVPQGAVSVIASAGSTPVTIYSM